MRRLLWHSETMNLAIAYLTSVVLVFAFVPGHFSVVALTNSKASRAGSTLPLGSQMSTQEREEVSSILKRDDKDSQSNDSRRETKIIYGIRHGRSESNEYMMLEGSRWDDPTFTDDMKFRDSPLSETGRKQVKALHQKLIDEGGDWLSEVELVIVSPLTRCLQTFEYGCRQALEHHFEPSPPPKILALTLASERVFSAGEIGRSSKTLETEFPEIDWSMLKDIEHDEAWWWTLGDEEEYTEWRPHGQQQHYVCPGEPEAIFEARMDALKEWIHNRPEKTILLIAHWGVLNHYTSQDMPNCGICRIEFGPDD